MSPWPALISDRLLPYVRHAAQTTLEAAGELRERGEWNSSIGQIRRAEADKVMRHAMDVVTRAENIEEHARSIAASFDAGSIESESWLHMSEAWGKRGAVWQEAVDAWYETMQSWWP